MACAFAAAGLSIVLATGDAVAARVTTWPIPEGIAPSADYRVTAGGVDIPVLRTPDTEYRPHFHLATNHYSFAQFDADGEVEVKVAWKGGSETFRARPPFKRVFQPFGRDSSLVLAANEPERDVPARNAPGVVYFGPGRHRADLTVLKSGETLYLAGGALLEGAVYANGTNITIRGRGILSGAPWPWKQGPKTPKSDKINLDYGILALVEGRGNVVRDIVLWSGWCYHLVLNEAEDCVVDNVKVLGGRVLNDDGIDPCRCRNLTIRNSFVRTQDDCLAPKFWIDGMTVSNMTLWSDCASPIRVGYECEKVPRGFRNLVFRNLEFLRLTRVPTAMEDYWARPAIQLQATNDTVFDGLLFEDIRIAAADPADTFLVFRTQTTTQMFLYDRAGTARNVTFRNIVLPSLPKGLPSLVSAHDPEHPIDGLRFENVSGLGPVKRVGAVAMSGPSFGASGVDLPKPIVCEGIYPWHPQGVATDGTNIYWSFTTALVRTDLRGKPLTRYDIKSGHMGDLCCHGGKVYVGINNGMSGEVRTGDAVGQFDGVTLALEKTYPTPQTVFCNNGLEWFDGSFWIVTNAPQDFPYNLLFEFTPDFRYKRTRVIATGQTLMGVQTILLAGDKMMLGCYGDIHTTYFPAAELRIRPGHSESSRVIPSTGKSSEYTAEGLLALDGFVWRAKGISYHKKGESPQRWTARLEPCTDLTKAAFGMCQ